MPSTQTDRINGVTTSAAVKTAVRIVTTTPITLSGAQTLQSVSLTAYSGPGIYADRVLVAGQADQTTNGIYLVQTSAWTREPDFDGSRDAVTGTLVPVRSGTYAGSIWTCTTTDFPITFGTSNITFVQDSLSQNIGVNAQTGTTYTFLTSDSGNAVTFNNASAITATIPKTLPAGFICDCTQIGAGQVTYSPASGATLHNRSSYTKSAGQWGVQQIKVVSNSDGNSAVFTLAGDCA